MVHVLAHALQITDVILQWTILQTILLWEFWKYFSIFQTSICSHVFTKTQNSYKGMQNNLREMQNDHRGVQNNDKETQNDYEWHSALFIDV